MTSAVCCSAPSTRPPQRRARASGWSAHRPTSSALPAMMPACGPPSSLSPLNVTSEAPSASVCNAAGSSASQAGGGPASHGTRASSRPLPRSTTTGTPSAANSATDVALDETVESVVAGVHLEHDGDVVAGADDRPLVVGQSGAIGGADVDQAGTRLLEHLGNPERPSDLHRLAPRHGDVAARRPTSPAPAARRRRCC